jgi:cytochrome c peroxidase
MRRYATVVSASLLGCALIATAQEYVAWWDANEARTFPRAAAARNENGTVTTLNAAGNTPTKGHPFFSSLGNNGRACVTCHQPSDGMALSVRSVQQRWKTLGHRDPLFASIDGANCPNLPPEKAESHSLLLNRGVFRIALPWPARDSNGRKIDPDFTIEVVRDPTGCNTSSQYGLNSANPQVSVYRRPRPVTNLRYIMAVGFPFDPKSGLPLKSVNGKMVSEALMADARALSLEDQMQDAMRNHLQMNGNPTPEQIRQIVEFESGLTTAQSHDQWGGSLSADGAQGGPEVLEKAPAGALQSTKSPIFQEFYGWKNAPAAGNEDQRKFRESVARGAELFTKRQFLVKDTAGINSMGFGNPVRNSCAMCHNMHGSGIDVAPGRIDLGTTNEPYAKPAPDLPLFKLTCKPGAKPHPFLGRVVYTQDPGYALTTGRCEDIGKITTQQMRGLSARAPYFSNGSASNLRELVDIYNRRYNINLTNQEREDLVNLMKVL